MEWPFKWYHPIELSLLAKCSGNLLTFLYQTKETEYDCCSVCTSMCQNIVCLMPVYQPTSLKCNVCQILVDCFQLSLAVCWLQPPGLPAHQLSQDPLQDCGWDQTGKNGGCFSATQSHVCTNRCSSILEFHIIFHIDDINISTQTLKWRKIILKFSVEQSYYITHQFYCKEPTQKTLKYDIHKVS